MKETCWLKVALKQHVAVQKLLNASVLISQRGQRSGPQGKTNFTLRFEEKVEIHFDFFLRKAGWNYRCFWIKPLSAAPQELMSDKRKLNLLHSYKPVSGLCDAVSPYCGCTPPPPPSSPSLPPPPPDLNHWWHELLWKCCSHVGEHKVCIILTLGCKKEKKKRKTQEDVI